MDFPQWAWDYVVLWRGRLFLQQWEITCKLARVVNDDAETLALCEQLPDVNHATLTFRDDLNDTPEWRDCIVHELLHVAHARVDHYVECALIPEVAESSQRFAGVVYHQQIEAFIDALATTLYQVTREQDTVKDRDAPEAV